MCSALQNMPTPSMHRASCRSTKRITINMLTLSKEKKSPAITQILQKPMKLFFFDGEAMGKNHRAAWGDNLASRVDFCAPANGSVLSAGGAECCATIPCSPGSPVEVLGAVPVVVMLPAGQETRPDDESPCLCLLRGYWGALLG